MFQQAMCSQGLAQNQERRAARELAEAEERQQPSGNGHRGNDGCVAGFTGL